jgi:hypothetical protein
MNTEMLGLVEMIGSFLIVATLVAWQLWSLRRDNKRAEEEKRGKEAGPNE